MWFLREKIYFSCNKCGNCCRDMDVPLTHYDIYRLLQSGTKFEPDEIITLYPSRPEELDSLIMYGEYKTLYLTNKLADNSCLFLENNACTIYNYRPNSCRIWPFSKNSLNTLLIDNVAGQLVSDFCDRKRFKDHKETLRLIDEGIEEVIEFRKFAGRWNKKVKDNPELQNFEVLIAEIKNLFEGGK